MPPITKCPNCRAVYSVLRESQGTHKKCDKCGMNFTVQVRLDETLTPLSAKSLAQPAMAAPKTGNESVLDKLLMVGPYVLKHKLGEGGMGEVYLAHDPNLDRDVAIKILPDAFSADKQQVERFLREARSAAKLHHGNAATVYQIGAEGNLIYIAMEYVDGRSLDKVVAASGPLNWREATAVIKDVAEALAVAHEIGLVHRDIKPSNLMQTESGVTKVVDFSIARAASANTNITQQGEILGTPAYMSPEQWMGKQTDARSDLYSLICTFYFLVTGKAPFEADSLVALGYQHRFEPFSDPRRLVPDLPKAVCQLLIKGSQKEPSKRFQSAKQLIAALNGLDFSALVEADGIDDVPVGLSVLPAGRTTSGRLGTRTMIYGYDATSQWPAMRPARFRSAASSPSYIYWWLAIGAAALGTILLLGITLHSNNNEGIVKIEFLDSSDTDIDFNKLQFEIEIDGDTIEISALKKPLKLAVGNHELTVSSNDFQTKTQSFTVERGTEVILRVNLVSKSSDRDASESSQPSG
jgi:serine/threonine protein kinase